MTLNTVLEIGDAFLHMLRADPGFVMFMAAIAGITRQVRGVTGGAGGRPAFTVVQREGMLSLKRGRRPGACAVAGDTVRAEFAGMFSRFGMAGNAGGIQPLEPAVLMAILTSRIQMFACQGEIGTAVIEFRIPPAGWIMAGRAIGAELPFMLILVLMAGITILGCGGKVRPGTGAGVAFFAGRAGMTALQFKGKSGVTEPPAKVIGPIVTIQADRTVRLDMGRGKDGIDLYVAAGAGIRCEGGDVIRVAVGADEGCLLNSQTVRFQ